MTNDLLLLEDDDVPLLWRGGLNSMEDLEEFFFFPKEIFSFIGGLEPGGMPFEEVAGTGAGWDGTVAAAPAAFFDLDFFGLLAFFGDFFGFLLAPPPPHFEQ